MLPLEHPGRMQIAFDDHRLVNNAGLLLPATLAQRVGLRELVDRGRTSSVLGCMVKAPSTLGTFLRSFRWGHVRQLDRVSRELLARAWAAGGGSGDGPLTIDLDSTICETYGLAKEGARHHGYTGKRGYYPLLAVAAGTGDVLTSRLREGRANTARGAAHFLRETVGRVRHAWASGPLTVRADSGFYTHSIVASTLRPYPRRTGRPSPTGWRAPPTWPRLNTHLSVPSPMPHRCGSSPAGSSPRTAPNWRCSPATAITPSSLTGRETPWNWRPTTAATPRSRMPSGT